MKENFPHPEPTYELQHIAHALKEKGLNDPHARYLLIEWTRIEEEGVQKSASTPTQVLGQIEFERQRGQLYIASEYVSEGLQALEDAMRIAVQEGIIGSQVELEEEIEGVLAN